ncbi:MAG: PAS domain-containing protein [Calditrichaeota bacterium]|nr:MAG: PAS domain-containing protein [Calditrichota bacterium]
MSNGPASICIVSNDPGRLDHFIQILSEPSHRLVAGNFLQAMQELLVEENPDLVIFDYVSFDNFDFRQVEPLRQHKNYRITPFLFIASPHHHKLIAQIYKDPCNHILLEPLNKYVLVAQVTAAIHHSRLERRVALYKNIVEGEKKMISYMDELLELGRLQEFENSDEMLSYIQTHFIKRLEMALAVELGVLGIHKKDNHQLEIRLFSEDGKELLRVLSLTVVNSVINSLFRENFPRILENDDLNDPFIQELEAILGYKISGLLFIPLVVLHKPLGAFILINKLYRNDFSENDLAFSTIAAQKVVYQLEGLEMGREISEEKVVQRLPLDSVARHSYLLETVLSAVDFGLVIFDANQRIHYANKAGLHILRKSEQPRMLDGLFDERSYAHIHANLEKNTFPVVRQELQIPVENSLDFYIGYSIYAMEWDAGENYFIIVFSEISQTKRLQAEILRMDRMASLGMLSSGIAHEIRNPLAGIKTMAQNMEEEIDENSLVIENVRRIIKQVDRLDDLLRSFFRYAKPTRPELKRVALASIVREVRQLFGRNLRNQSVELVEQYAPGLYPLFVDANQIQQVLINMLLNSMQAMPDGGTVTVYATNASRDALPALDRRKRGPGLLANSYVEILFTDTGSGFAPEIKDKIFTPFFTQKASGTGLGLSIVYQIVKEHGGQIDVESTLGVGTKFRILLPAIEPQLRTVGAAAKILD